MSYEFIPVGTDDNAIKEVAALLRMVFPNAKKYSDTFIEWQYKQNPDGQVLGYNAYENGLLAAHYALIPLTAKLFGSNQKGLLSLNTATHPSHQGKKLFTSLAQLSYSLAKEKGYQFVVGVANANSTPGFVNNLGFQLVTPLDAKLGIGKIARSGTDSSLQYIKNWSEETIQWRLKNPAAKYKVKNNVLYSATDTLGIEAILLDTRNMLQLTDNELNIGYRPFKLWLGIDNTINWNKSFYVNIPIGLRPSPLNFIFKDLTGENRKLMPDKVLFSAFDFDAY